VGRWNGQARETVVLSDNELLLLLTATDLSLAGDGVVTVLTPGAAESAGAALRVRLPGEKPVPVLAQATLDLAGGRLYATGSDFDPGAVVWINGVARPTTFEDTTRLSVALTMADLGGTVVVVNPGPGGGSSTTKTFLVWRVLLPLLVR